MTPTLFGRIQTRIFIVATVGALWTLVITPVLPDRGPLPDAYAVTYKVLLIVMVAGVGWECVYQLLQQFRWEKDWPALFGLLTGINEGIVTFLIARALNVQVTATAFVVDFSTTWIVLWITVNGPMRVPFIRWRYRGGRIL